MAAKIGVPVMPLLNTGEAVMVPRRARRVMRRVNMLAGAIASVGLVASL